MERAITDPLTGAFNRRHVDSCLMTAIERRNRTGEPASLLMLDVDHFKRINDALRSPGRRRSAEASRGAHRRTRAQARRALPGRRRGIPYAPSGTRYDGAIAVAENLRLLVAHSALIEGHRMSISIGVSELQARAVGRRLDRGRRRGRVSSETVRAESRTRVRPAARSRRRFCVTERDFAALPTQVEAPRRSSTTPAITPVRSTACVREKRLRAIMFLTHTILAALLLSATGAAAPLPTERLAVRQRVIRRFDHVGGNQGRRNGRGCDDLEDLRRRPSVRQAER